MKRAIALTIVTGIMQVVIPTVSAEERVTPPVVLSRASPEAMRRCYPPGQPEGDVEFIITISERGEPTGVTFAPGTEAWAKQVAKCVVLNMRFSPGTIDGKPVVSTAKLPLHLRHTTNDEPAVELTRARIRSSPDQRDAIAERCYPRGRTETATVVLWVTISQSGRLEESKIGQSSGDPDLDAAAQCMVAAYRFEPGMRGSAPVSMSQVQRVTVKPPDHHVQPAGSSSR